MSEVAVTDLALCDSIPGAYTTPELENLYRLVESVPDGSTVMEIGVGMGRTAGAILQLARRKRLTVYLVDNWDTGRSWYECYAKMVAEHFIDVPHVLVNARSKDAVRLLPKLSLSFIHIDGDHSYDSVLADCENWLPCLEVGGVACFHDYHIVFNPEGIFAAIGDPVEVQVLRRTVNIRVREAVEDYMDEEDWEPLKAVDKQMSFRRLK